MRTVNVARLRSSCPEVVFKRSDAHCMEKHWRNSNLPLVSIYVVATRARLRTYTTWLYSMMSLCWCEDRNCTRNVVRTCDTAGISRAAMISRGNAIQYCSFKLYLYKLIWLNVHILWYMTCIVRQLWCKVLPVRCSTHLFEPDFCKRDVSSQSINLLHLCAHKILQP